MGTTARIRILPPRTREELSRTRTGLIAEVKIDKIIELLSEGMTRKDVAAYFGITIGTLKTYMYQVYASRGFRDQVDMIIQYWKRKVALAHIRPVEMEDFYSIVSKEKRET